MIFLIYTSISHFLFFYFFFFNDTATTEIYTLSLHDALPILSLNHYNVQPVFDVFAGVQGTDLGSVSSRDRKSTRLNSSHLVISYAVFCLKKKKKEMTSCYHLKLLT